MAKIIKNISNFKQISSPQNEQVKTLKKLALKKYRIERNEFMIENLTIILDALKSGYDFESLFVTGERFEKYEEKINNLCADSSCKNVYLIDERINKHYSQLDTPSGIAAVYKIKKTKLTDTSVIYLDQINDPGNLGTIMRSALAFGFENLVLDKNCADVFNPKTISAARDAIFKLNILEDNDGSWLENTTMPIYISSSHNGISLAQFKPATKYCIAFGNESHGTSPEIGGIATEAIKIEMTANIESLNVASAAAIILYELGKKQVKPEGH